MDYKIHKCSLADKIVNETVIKTALAIRGSKKIFSNEDGAYAYIKALEEREYDVAKANRKVCGNTTYSIIGNENSQKKVLYLHGGAFIRPLTYSHIKMIKALSKKSGCCFIVADYLLAPHYTCEESTKELVALYKEMLNETESKNIIFMGDSSGGTLCVTLIEWLREEGLPLPDKLILLSPFLGIDCEKNENACQNAKNDPMFGGTGGMAYCVKRWLGNTDINSPKANPMYAQLAFLPQTHIITGKSDILYFEIIEFFRKAKENGVNITLDLFENMYHVFMFYPLRTAKTAQKMILEALANE